MKSGLHTTTHINAYHIINKFCYMAKKQSCVFYNLKLKTNAR